MSAAAAPKRFSEMTYDEQRAFLGLPGLTYEVILIRSRAAKWGLVREGFAAAMNRVGK